MPERAVRSCAGETVSAPPPLSLRLRRATQASHQQAERSGAMQALLQGRLARERYCVLLRNLHALYAALERALDLGAGSPAVAAVRMPELYREPALRRDLDHLGGEQWPRWPLAATMREYVTHLGQLTGTRAHLLAAHAYVRYLGDLSGGQVLKDIVTRTMGLGDGAGSTFYAFGPDVAPDTAKQRFRTALDTLPVDDSAAAGIIAEAVAAFALHVRLFEELDDSRTKR
jgi:heme oxygenase